MHGLATIGRFVLLGASRSATYTASFLPGRPNGAGVTLGEV